MAGMHVEVNGVRLAFCVGSGLHLAPRAPRAHVVLLRGGAEGRADPLAGLMLDDVAACVRLDLRGSGGSEVGPAALLHLEQWAWDLRVFCAAIGLEQPLVSAAGVNAVAALLYAARNRAHPAGLLLWEPIWEPERIAPWLRPDRKDLDVAGELARVACPVRVFASDPRAEASARALARHVPEARLDTIPGADVRAIGILASAFLTELAAARER